MGGWLGWSGSPEAWGVRRGAGSGGTGGGNVDRAAAPGGEMGRGQSWAPVGEGAGAGGGGGLAGPGDCGRGGGGGGGGGALRRGAHFEAGEVASGAAGDGRPGQRAGTGGPAGRVRLQSSRKMGFTNHSRSFPTDSSISHAQLEERAAGLRLQSLGAPGAGSLGASNSFPLPRRRFSEEAQKPRPRLQMVSSSAQLLAPRMAAGSLRGKGSKSLLTQ